MVLRYLDLLEETTEERIVIFALRVFLSRFAKGCAGVSTFLERIHRADTIPLLREVIDSFSFTQAR